MSEYLTVEQVVSIDDTDVLWEALKGAKKRDDLELVRAIENRMRQLGEQRRFAHLSDEELVSQIRGLMGNRAPKEVLANNPSFDGGAGQAADISELNRRIRANADAGVQATLNALLDEWRRRQQPS